jgi:hypothetical protein
MSPTTILAGVAHIGPVADAFTGPAVEQTQTAPPMPAPLAGVVLLLVLASVALVIASWRRRRRGGPGGYRGHRGGAAVGNALMEFNAVFAPHHADAAVIRQLEEEPETDDIAGP